MAKFAIWSCAIAMILLISVTAGQDEEDEGDQGSLEFLKYIFTGDSEEKEDGGEKSEDERLNEADVALYRAEQLEVANDKSSKNRPTLESMFAR
ncbi:hypothetical protein HDE_06041 [Halotydeus destructor]|nr:hypothetical protein HDE_06041 [Halotydeus destructor]